MGKLVLILILLALITLCLLIGLAFIFLIKARAKFLENVQKDIQNKTSKQRQAALEWILKRVSLIAKSNTEYNPTIKELITIYKKFTKSFAKLKIDGQKIKVKIKQAKFSIKNIKHQFAKFNELDLKIKNLEKKFNRLSNLIMAQDEILRKEFHFYQKSLRKALSIYEKKKVLLDFVQPKIDNFAKSIRYIEKEFESGIDQGDNIQVQILIQRYVSKIVKFIKIINYGPALAMQIKFQIPEAIEKIRTNYFQTNNQLGETKNETFQKILKSIAKPFNKAKKAFLNLDVDLTIQNVKTTLKKISSAEDNFNLELKARVNYNKIKLDINFEYQRVSKNWKNLDQKFEGIASSGKIINPSLFESYNHAKTSFSKLKSESQKYFDAIKKTNSNVTKMQQSTFLLETLKRTMAIANNFVNNLRKLELDKTIAKAKFYKAEITLHNIIGGAKQKAIILSRGDHQKINEIINEKTLLVTKLNGLINREIKEQIETFSKRVANLYKLISSKMQMAFHIENIIHEFASKRALNQKLNIGLKIAETKYLEGDYATSLNEIINCMRDSHLYS